MITLLLTERNFKIYIPIWIDLKVVKLIQLFYAVKDLHSNMDRFESRYINSTVVIISYYMDIVNMLCINKFNVILNLFICESMIFTVKIAAVDLRHFSVYRRSTVDFLFR